MSSNPRNAVNLSDLAPRIASAVVMAALALGTAWFGDRVYIIFWLAVSAAIFWEWTQIVAPDARLKFAIGAVALAAIAPAIAGGAILYAVLILAVAMGLLAGLPSTRRLWHTLGLLYAASLLMATIMLRFSFPLGLPAIFWLFAVVWGTDVMAYFGGRFIGGPKLWPRVSPSKTWSGFLTGIFSGALLGLLIGAQVDMPVWPIFLLGLVTGAVAQGGDLLESSFKRHFGVKDASNLIPGHGGFMDRLDGFLAAAVFACIFGALRAGIFDPANGLLAW